MTARRVAIVTLGCPKNLTDSEVMAGLLGRAGFTVTDELEAADAIVVNTCAFIGPAREEAWREIGRAAALRRDGRCRALIVTGCLAQGFAGEIERRVPEADRLLGTGEVGRVAEAVASALRPGAAKAEGPRQDGDAVAPGYLPGDNEPRLVSTPAHYAYLKIAEGCSHHCAFCLIPSLRGPYRSRSVDSVVAEARALDRIGTREIILVAQDTTVYGRDLAGRPLLADLVRRILDETAVAWLRVLYGYPSTLPDEFVALLARETSGWGGPPGVSAPAWRGETPVSAEVVKAASGRGRLCRYLDLPMQHASDPILRAMRRPETGEFLLRLVERLRREVPGLTLRSTFIVGFPGETEKDFQTLLDFLATARLEHAGFFAYSREEGTAAGELPHQVDDGLKEERLARAAEVQRRVSLSYRRGLIGSTPRVLVDQVLRCGSRGGHPGRVRLWARSEGDAPEIDGRVLVDWSDGEAGSAPEPGDFVEVKVTGARAYDLLARR